MALPLNYVKLLREQTGLYASFEPSLRVELGDYGRVHRTTGEFISEGNIFEKKEGEKSLAEQLGIEAIENDGPVFHKVCSKRATVIDLAPQANV